MFIQFIQNDWSRIVEFIQQDVTNVIRFVSIIPPIVFIGCGVLSAAAIVFGLLSQEK